MILRFRRSLVVMLAVLALLLPAVPQVGPMQAGMNIGNAPMTAGITPASIMIASVTMPLAGTCTDCDHQPMMGQNCAAPCQTAMGLPIEFRSAMPIAIATYTLTPQRLYVGVLISPDPSPPRTSFIA